MEKTNETAKQKVFEILLDQNLYAANTMIEKGHEYEIEAVKSLVLIHLGGIAATATIASISPIFRTNSTTPLFIFIFGLLLAIATMLSASNFLIASSRLHIKKFNQYCQREIPIEAVGKMNIYQTGWFIINYLLGISSLILFIFGCVKMIGYIK